MGAIRPFGTVTYSAADPRGELSFPLRSTLAIPRSCFKQGFTIAGGEKPQDRSGPRKSMRSEWVLFVSYWLKV